MSANKFLSTENGLRHEKIAILDAGAQYGKVYYNNLIPGKY